jgi:large subunit ribosomal protein L25
MAELKAKVRNEFGKGFARRTRQAGDVPAIIYVKGDTPKHITVNTHDATLLLRQTNVLIDIDINGEKIKVLPRDIQRNTLTHNLEHIDFITAQKGETIKVDVEVNVVGEPLAPAIALVNYQTIELEADMTNIPEQIDIKVDDMQEGDSVKSTDITLPEGSKFTTDEEFTIISITIPKAEVISESEESTEEAEESTEAESGDNKEADSKSENEQKETDAKADSGQKDAG